MSSIFISHSSRDGEVAAEMRRRLEAEGHGSVFLDFDPADGIPAGRSWEQELYARLRACQAVIVLCSEHSMASDWVFAEITHARALGKHVFPVLVAPCEVRSLLTDVQIIDHTADPEAAYERLWRGLRLAGLDPKSAFDWDGSRSPYPGLLAFQEEDAAIFFGRSAEIGEGLSLLHRLRSFGGTRWVVVLGGSGSGKSSLVRAGLLPRLRRDPDAWSIVGPFRPLHRPFDELGRALARAFTAAGDGREAADLIATLRSEPSDAAVRGFVDLADDLRRAAQTPEAGVLLVVDQVEELMAGDDDGEAGGFLAFLRAALELDGSPLTLLGTLRSDFLGNLQKHPALRELPFASLSVGPLSVDGFAEVIEGPARLAGIDLESGLVQAMVADTETDDALPLLAFTLRELWDGYGDGQKLELPDYRDRLGGLSGSVARAAETALGATELPAAQEVALRNAFLSLVRIDDDGRYVRRPARWDALPAASHQTLERFVAARLLTTGGDGEERTLEVAHEALLRVWKRLVGWLDDDRVFLTWRKRIGGACADWKEGGRRAGYLLRGTSLGEAAGWLASRGEMLEDQERAFIRASVKADRRRRYRLVAIFAMVAIALGILAFRAETERRRAEKMRVGATDLTRQLSARRLAKMAQAIPFGGEQLSRLAGQALVQMERPELFQRTVDIESQMMAMRGQSPDLMLVAMLSPTGVDIRSLLDRRWRVPLAHEAPVVSVVIEPEQTRRALLGRPVARGRLVLTADGDGVARLWSLPSHYPLVDALLEEGDLSRVDALFGPDGARNEWLEATLLIEFDGHDGPISRMAFGPGARYALTVAGSEVAVWRTDSGAQPPLLSGHDDAVTWAAFDLESRRLVTASADRRSLVWSLEDPFAAPLELAGHSAGLVAAAFSADSSRVLTAATDREIRQWSVDTGDGTPVATMDCDPTQVAYTGTEGLAAVACSDGTARILNLATGAAELFR